MAKLKDKVRNKSWSGMNEWVGERVRRILESEGYFVISFRGSTGPVEIVALPKSKSEKTMVRLIQVRNRQGLRAEDSVELTALSKSLGGLISVEAWVRRKRWSLC